MKNKGKKKTEYGKLRRFLRAVRIVLGQEVRPFLAYTLVFVVTASLLYTAAQTTGALSAYAETLAVASASNITKEEKIASGSNISKIEKTESGETITLDGDDENAIIDQILELYQFGEITAKKARRLLAEQGISVKNAPFSWDDEDEITDKEWAELEKIAAENSGVTEEEAIEALIENVDTEELEEVGAIMLATVVKNGVIASASDISYSNDIASASDIVDEEEKQESVKIASSNDLKTEDEADDAEETTGGAVQIVEEAVQAVQEALSELVNSVSSSLLMVAYAEEKTLKDLTEYVSTLNVSAKNENGEWVELSEDGLVTDGQGMQVLLGWSLDQDAYDTDTTYFYTLPSGLKLSQDISGNITEDETVIGNFVIDAETNQIQIQYTQDYSVDNFSVVNVLALQGSVQEKSTDANGQIVFTAAENQVTATVSPQDLSKYIQQSGISIEKKNASGEWKTFDGTKDTIGNGDTIAVRLNWTLTKEQFTKCRQYYYQLPSAIKLTEKQVGQIKRRNSNTVIGTYTVSEDGLVVFNYNDNFAEEDGDAECDFWLEAKASYAGSGDSGKIVFKYEGGEIEIAEIKIPYDIKLSKSGELEDADTLKYKVTIKTEHGTDPEQTITVQDLMESTDYTFTSSRDRIQIKKYNADGNFAADIPVTEENVSINASGSFDIVNLPALAKGESYKISYTVDIANSEAVETNSGVKYTYAKNTVKAKWTGGQEVSKDKTIEITKDPGAFANKSGKYDQDKNVIHWTVVINKSKNYTIGGWTFYDSPETFVFERDGQTYNRIVEDSIKFYKTDASNTVISSTQYQFDSDKNSLQYTFPGNMGKESYTVEYDTTVPKLEYKESFTAKNTAKVNGEDFTSTVKRDEWDAGFALDKKSQGYVMVENTNEATGKSYSKQIVGEKTYIFPKWTAEVKNITKSPLTSLTVKDSIKAAKRNDNNYDDYHYGIAGVLDKQLRKNMRLTLRDGKTVNPVENSDYKVEIHYYPKTDIKKGEEITDLSTIDPSKADKVRGFTVTVSRVDQNDLNAAAFTLGEYTTVQDISAAKSGELWTATNKMEAGDRVSEVTIQYVEPGKKLEKQVSAKAGTGYTSENQTLQFDSLDAGGILHYRLLLPTSAVDNGKDLVITDTLPEGMRLVEDSVYAKFVSGTDGNEVNTNWEGNIDLSSNETFVVTSPLSDGSNGFQIAIKNYQWKNDHSLIRIYYDVELQSAWKDTVSVKSFKNTVEWTSRDSKDTVDLETKVERDFAIISKTGTQLKTTVENVTGYQAQLDYQIVINPTGMKIGDQEYLLLVDTLSAHQNMGNLNNDVNIMNDLNPKLMTSSVKLYHYDSTKANNRGAEITDARFRYTYSVDETVGSRFIDITIPNETPCVLEYSYEISREKIVKNYTIRNKAILNGEYSSSDGVALVEVKSGSSASKETFTLRKVDSENYGKMLEGAKFRILKFDQEEEKFTNVSLDGAEDGVFTVNGEKNWDLTKDNSLKTNTLYQIEEITAPENYKRDESKYYFIIKKEGQSNDEAYTEAVGTEAAEVLADKEILYFSVGDTFNFENHAFLQVYKQWLDVEGNEMKETPDSIKFTLWKTAKSSNHTVYIESRSSDPASTTKWSSYGPISIPDGASVNIQLIGNISDSLSASLETGQKADVYLAGEMRDYVSGGVRQKASENLPINVGLMGNNRITEVKLTNIQTDIHLIFTVGNGWDADTFGTVTVDNKEVDEEVAQKVGTYTIYENGKKNKSGNPWLYVFDELPMEENGKRLYYFVTEDTVLSDYKVSIDKANVQTGQIVITNQALKKIGYELPETGGSGVHRMYMLGSMLVLLAGAVLCYKKRKEGGYSL